MNPLRLGVAVAAAAVSDPETGEHQSRGAGRERRPVIGPERERAGRDRLLADRVLDDGDRFACAAARLEAPTDDLAGAAVDDRVQVTPAVLSDPD